jgi:hypothetical protein
MLWDVLLGTTYEAFTVAGKALTEGEKARARDAKKQAEMTKTD